MSRDVSCLVQKVARERTEAGRQPRPMAVRVDEDGVHGTRRALVGGSQRCGNRWQYQGRSRG